MSKATKVLLASVAIMATATATASVRAQKEKPAASVSGVNVTVKYTGKGSVDADHRIWVWLFDNPNISAGSVPVAEMAIEKNGGTARFTGVTAKEVYVAVAYDEKGGFVGQAPPPPGSPIALYGVKGDKDPPVAVTPGPKASVTIALSDAQRMQ